MSREGYINRRRLPVYKNSVPEEKYSIPVINVDESSARRPAPPSLGALTHRTFHPESIITKLFIDRHKKAASYTTLTDSKNDRLYNTTPPSSEYSSQEDSHLPPIAPDGGYGWYIVIASFVANLLIDGLFLSEFNEIFEEPRWKTSIIMSLLTGYGFTGPIVASLANKYGCRGVTICGSVVSFIAFMLGSFSTNIFMLIITFGLIGGVGLGMMYLPSIVIVGFYFDKKRSLATGISVCGSSIGGFIFPMLYTYLVDRYDWVITLRILSVIMLLGCCSGYTYLPLKARILKTKKKPQLPTIPIKPLDKIKTTEIANKLWTIDEDMELLTHTVKIPNSSMLVNGQDNISIVIDHCFPIHTLTRNTLDRVHLRFNEEVPGSARSVSVPAIYYQTKAKPNINIASAAPIMISEHLNESNILLENQNRDLHRPIYRKDIFFESSVQRLQTVARNSGDIQKFILALTDIPEPVDFHRKWYQTILGTLKRLIDVNLLKDSVFRIYCMTSFLCLLGLFTPFIYLPMGMKQDGYNTNEIAKIISIIGITNAVSRVVVGYISSFSEIDCILVSGTAQTIAGISTFLIPFLSSYNQLTIYAIIFGSSIAAWVALQSIVIVKLKGIDLLTNAFGLNCMFKGFACFIGPPLAGGLSELTNSINAVFFMAGTAMTLGGLLTFTLKKHTYSESKVIADVFVNLSDTKIIEKKRKSEIDALIVHQ